MSAPILWLIAAAALAVGETLSGDLVLFMLAGGALGGAGAATLGAPVWAQAIVFAIVSFIAVFAVRPTLRKQLMTGSGGQTNSAALIGQSATAIEPVDTDSGLISLGGDQWTARPFIDGETFTVGESVRVHSIEGATARVMKDY